jgi:hypothetical protein
LEMATLKWKQNHQAAQGKESWMKKRNAKILNSEVQQPFGGSSEQVSCDWIWFGLQFFCLWRAGQG